MNIKKRKVPIKHETFFEDIAKVFQKYPEMKQHYSIATRKQLNKLNSKKGDQIITQRLEEDKIVIQLAHDIKPLDCCCQWGVDDDGNTFCLVSGDDCC